MKGVSAVIATILMLMITIAMAGVAYMYISGIFTSATATGVEVVDVYCGGGNAVITLRNNGNEALTLVSGACSIGACGSLTVSRTAPSAFAGADVFSASIASALPGTTFTLTDADCTSGVAAGTCVYRLIPPGQAAVAAQVYCTS